MARVARPIFRRGLEYVAVRPIRLTKTKVLKPGEKIDLPNYRLRSLFLRRKCGPKDHPWTNFAIKAARTSAKAVPTAPSKETVEVVEQVATKDDRPWLIEGTDLRFKTKTEAAEAAQDGQAVTKDGLIWVKGDQRFKTKKAAESA